MLDVSVPIPIYPLLAASNDYGIPTRIPTWRATLLPPEPAEPILSVLVGPGQFRESLWWIKPHRHSGQGIAGRIINDESVEAIARM
jgi:hypothetical protein